MADVVLYHGAERQPVLVIDDFAPRPDLLVADAAMLGWGPIGTHYPGLRAGVADAIVDPLLDPWIDTIADLFGVAQPFRGVETTYSVVTTPPAALTPVQRMPHFDTVDPGTIALLLYLMPEPRGGTAFFRHRTTGFETVDAGRLAAYEAALATDVAAHGMPDAGYIAGDTPLFEQIGMVEARWNRAIVYRGHRLHCAAVPPDLSFVADPARGRLTMNTFIDADPCA